MPPPRKPPPRFLDEAYVCASVDLASVICTLEGLYTGEGTLFPPHLTERLPAIITALRHLRRRVVLAAQQPEAQPPGLPPPEASP